VRITVDPDPPRAGAAAQVVVEAYAANGGQLRSIKVEFGDGTDDEYVLLGNCAGTEEPGNAPGPVYRRAFTHAWGEHGTYAITASMVAGGCGRFEDRATGTKNVDVTS
jgi:hypothetical protein